MPVTARLSRRFYETFGDEIANELVEWFNQVDATYRSDLKELNDLNFARFDAKLEQRLAQFDAKLEQRFAQFDAKLERRFAEYEKALADTRTDVIRWMFLFWIGTVVPLGGLAVALAR